MVNTCIMNIDVREYLRINPISVHELTLQGNAKDCFLFFKDREPGYSVVTQKKLFWELYKAIFQDLVEVTKDGKMRFRIERILPQNESVSVRWEKVHLTDDQFTNYIKNWEMHTFMSSFEYNIGELEKQISD